MKNRTLFPALLLIVLIISSFSKVEGQTPKNKKQQQDTTKLIDPINRMPDSIRLKKMMRDSNIMENQDQMMQDSMPVKKGWINSDSTRRKNTRI